jgi:hypothetical protein
MLNFVKAGAAGKNTKPYYPRLYSVIDTNEQQPVENSAAHVKTLFKILRIFA